MTYHGAVALSICSTGVVLSALALQFIDAYLPAKERRRPSLWLIGTALLLLCVAGSVLRSSGFAGQQTITAVALTAALLTGVHFKWLCETIAQKKLVLHEAVLAKAMLAAPLMVVYFGDRILTAQFAPGAFVLWFLNGYFWHAFLSDIDRVLHPEKIIIRRREPPTLPHDFKRPEID